MNCKGSPYSTASTGLTGSPQTKVKFSRKFIINLQEDLPEKPNNNEQEKLAKKILRYKRRYRAKKALHSEANEKNCQLRNQLESEKEVVDMLYKQLGDNFELYEKLILENTLAEKEFEKAQDILEFERNYNKSMTLEEAESSISPAFSLLEDLQEKIFVSNKKTNDLERLLSREQKKNEQLIKDLRNYKLDLSSKESMNGLKN